MYEAAEPPTRVTVAQANHKDVRRPAASTTTKTYAQDARRSKPDVYEAAERQKKREPNFLEPKAKKAARRPNGTAGQMPQPQHEVEAVAVQQPLEQRQQDLKYLEQQELQELQKRQQERREAKRQQEAAPSAESVPASKLEQPAASWGDQFAAAERWPPRRAELQPKRVAACRAALDASFAAIDQTKTDLTGIPASSFAMLRRCRLKHTQKAEQQP